LSAPGWEIACPLAQHPNVFPGRGRARAAERIRSTLEIVLLPHAQDGSRVGEVAGCVCVQPSAREGFRRWRAAGGCRSGEAIADTVDDLVELRRRGRVLDDAAGQSEGRGDDPGAGRGALPRDCRRAKRRNYLADATLS
jgi:hypothetical protein